MRDGAFGAGVNQEPPFEQSVEGYGCQAAAGFRSASALASISA